MGWDGIASLDGRQGIEMTEIKEVVELSCVLMNSELCF